MSALTEGSSSDVSRTRLYPHPPHGLRAQITPIIRRGAVSERRIPPDHPKVRNDHLRLLVEHEHIGPALEERVGGRETRETTTDDDNLDHYGGIGGRNGRVWGDAGGERG